MHMTFSVNHLWIQWKLVVYNDNYVFKYGNLNNFNGNKTILETKDSGSCAVHFEHRTDIFLHIRFTMIAFHSFYDMVQIKIKEGNKFQIIKPLIIVFKHYDFMYFWSFKFLTLTLCFSLPRSSNIYIVDTSYILVMVRTNKKVFTKRK